MKTILTNRDPSRTALLVVDMVNDFVVPGPSGHYSTMAVEFSPRLEETANFFRAQGACVVWVTMDSEQYRADPFAGTLAPAFHPQKEDLSIVKTTYDAFFNTDLHALLQERSIKTVIITGVCTEVCCLSTARSAQALGYETVFVSDLTGNFSYEDKGFGAMTDREMHRAMMILVDRTTAEVLSAQQAMDLISSDGTDT